MKPTKKQIQRVKHMCYVLGITEPKYSKEDYSQFISKYKNEYINELENAECFINDFFEESLEGEQHG